MRMRLLFNAHLQMDFAFMFSVTQDLYNFYRFLCQYAYWEINIAAVLFSTQISSWKSKGISKEMQKDFGVQHCNDDKDNDS